MGGATKRRLVVDDEDAYGIGHPCIFPPASPSWQGADTPFVVWTARVPSRSRVDDVAEDDQTRIVGRAVTHYEVLGIRRAASAAEIRTAYRELARRYHPDVSDDAAASAMAAVNEAWRVLGDPERRAAYDATLDVPSAPPRPRVRAERARETTPDVDARPSWWNEPLTDDPSLDVPITDGRVVQRLGMLVAIAGALAVAAVVALFAYAILWAG
jgi:DnaJ domain